MAALSVSALHRALSWHRRKLAVVCAALAVLATVAAVAPDPPPSAPVLVAVRALPGGVRLGEADVELRLLDQRVLPEEALDDAAELVGRTLTAPVTAGTMLTRADVLAPRPRPDGASAAAGAVLAPVRVVDAQVVGLLRVGDPVDVLGTDPSDGAVGVVAEGARVAVLPVSESGGGGLLTGAGEGGSLVVLEVDPDTAVALAEASSTGALSLLLR